MSEYTLISQLLRKIRRDPAVQQRWIPSFSPPLVSVDAILNQDIGIGLSHAHYDIRGTTLSRPKTIGQWFLTILIEKVGWGSGRGVGLRTLIYCVTWCARLIHDEDFERLAQSAHIIKTWILQDMCRDCVYKSLRELRED